MRCFGGGPNALMRKIAVLPLLIVLLGTNALATWSVIAVDRKTGQVAIASATCVPQLAFAGFPATGLKDVQAIINKTSHVAYLVVANKSDKIGEGLNDGKYNLEIQVTDQDIGPDENDNPVKTLRMRYNRWVREHANRVRPKSH